MAQKKGGLGRGLESLFNENANDEKGTVTIRLNDIEPNRDQPRKDFDEGALTELSQSIEKYGLLQPIIVHPLANGCYKIIAGERRWRACRMAGLDEVPVIIKDIDDKLLMEIALIENLQREDLNAVEEALGYKSLIDNFAMTQEQVSERMGKSRSAVTNALRLLNLSNQELEALKSGKISAGHARCLLSTNDGKLRESMLNLALNGASVRELERMSVGSNNKKKSKKVNLTKNYYREVELSLKDELHRKVHINPSGEGKGMLTIEFFSDEELTEFAKKLAGDDLQI